MRPNTITEFDNVCSAIKKSLYGQNPIKFIAGRFENPIVYKDNFMWISTSDNEIGFSQCHYEIRLCEDLSNPSNLVEYISVEIHIESSKSKISNGLSKNIQTVLTTVQSSIGSNYIWNSTGKRFPVNINQVTPIIKELTNLDSLIGQTIKNNIKQTLG
ncbi:MAG: hypothetical protein KBT11_02400 [Treponema sp.]|nr:hypothetical protein [Candidatus Treponema equifaecale]